MSQSGSLYKYGWLADDNGDIYCCNSTNDTRLPVGSDGQLLMAKLSASTGLSYQTVFPSSSVNGDLASFSGTGGNLLQDSGTQTLTNKTLTTPNISQISNSGTLTLSTTTRVILSGPSSTTSGDFCSYNSTMSMVKLFKIQE